MDSLIRVRRAGFLVMFVTGLLAGPAFAQQGQINGVISDSSGA